MRIFGSPFPLPMRTFGSRIFLWRLYARQFCLNLFVHQELTGYRACVSPCLDAQKGLQQYRKQCSAKSFEGSWCEWKGLLPTSSVGARIEGQRCHPQLFDQMEGCSDKGIACWSDCASTSDHCWQWWWSTLHPCHQLAALHSEASFEEPCFCYAAAAGHVGKAIRSFEFVALLRWSAGWKHFIPWFDQEAAFRICGHSWIGFASTRNFLDGPVRI